MRLAVRTPYAGRALLALPRRPGDPGRRGGRRRLVRPHARAAARHRDGPRSRSPTSTAPGETAFVTATFALEDLRDTAAATERVRRLLDADCDPVAVADAFAGDPVIGPLVRALPGLRVPGHVDGNEVAVRAVLGQQVSVAGARTVAARLHARARPPAGPAGRRADAPVPGRGHARRAGPRGPADAALAGPGADRAVRRARRRRPGAGPRRRTGTTYAAGCWRSRASARGPPTTSRCGRSGTRTCSCPPTWASATRSPGWATTRPGRRARRGLAPVAFLRTAVPLADPDAVGPAGPDRGELTCGP